MIDKFMIGARVWPGLSKLIEESGEVNQVVGKLIATGGKEEHWDGTNLRDRMQEELADLIAACSFVVDVNNLDIKAVERRANEKLSMFRQWHKEQGGDV